MTKEKIRTRLLAGETLDDILVLRPGQECFIFKEHSFRPGADVIYVPDIDLNEIPAYVDISDDVELIDEVLDDCYTGDDFIEQCGGDATLAEALFYYVDWQHPSSAYDEVVE